MMQLSRSLFLFLRDRAKERREPEGVVRVAAAGERWNSEPCEPAVQHGLHAGSGDGRDGLPAAGGMEQG